MRFSSSELLRAILLLGLFSTGAIGCSPVRRPEIRLPAPHIAPLPQSALPGDKRGGSWLGDLYPPSAGLEACQWLDTTTRPVDAGENFQLLERSKVLMRSGALEVSGSVNSGGSPLYSYALLSQTIPNKREFLSLVDQEIQKTSGYPWKLILGEWLMKAGLVDAYEQRNAIIEEKINEALPGIFDPEIRMKQFRKSIPWMILMNGSPELATAPVQVHQRVLEQFAKSFPVFPGTTWQALAEDFRFGLSTALRAFKTRDPKQKACAAMILHRTLSQLFMIIGYDRLPFESRGEGKSYHLPPLSELLDSKEGNRFMVCPTAGSFVLDGRRIIIDRDVLSSFDPDKALFELSSGPVPLRICNRKEAIPYSFDLHQNHIDEEPAALAQGSDWLALINSLAQFLTAMNPGADWWQDPANSVGFPMAPFESLERIQTSGAILPVDANALSLGLLNLSLGSFIRKHLVFLNDANEVVSDMEPASKIRVSETDLGANPPVLKTTLASATLLAEIAFKMGETLRTLTGWHQRAEAAILEDLGREKDSNKRKRLILDYRNFIEGMYGSTKTLQDLTSTGKDSLRENLESLKLASALLLAEFARKTEDGTFDCAQRLELDRATQLELKQGRCSREEARLWKYSLKLIATEYRSPHFAALAE